MYASLSQQAVMARMKARQRQGESEAAWEASAGKVGRPAEVSGQPLRGELPRLPAGHRARRSPAAPRRRSKARRAHQSRNSREREKASLGKVSRSTTALQLCARKRSLARIGRGTVKERKDQLAFRNRIPERRSSLVQAKTAAAAATVAAKRTPC